MQLIYGGIWTVKYLDAKPAKPRLAIPANRNTDAYLYITRKYSVVLTSGITLIIYGLWLLRDVSMLTPCV